MLQGFAHAHENVMLLRNEENLGSIKSCNAAMREASGDILALLHSDTVVPSSAAERIVECFHKGAKRAVASPLSSSRGRAVLTMPEGQTLEGMNHAIQQHYEACYPMVSSCSGFFLCVRRSLLGEIGYFDELYGRGSHGVADLCHRAIVHGYECALIDDLYVLHKGNASSESRLSAEEKLQDDAVFNKRWRGFAQRWNRRNRYQCPVKNIESAIAPPVKVPFKFYRKVKEGRTRKVYIAGIHILSYDRKPKQRSASPVAPSVTPKVTPKVADRPDALQTMLYNNRHRKYKAAFSIIMPTYNRAYCIRRAIDSVLAQWYENFELIVIDDGSTDQTESMLRELYAEELAAKKIIFHRLDCNEGLCVARNVGLSLAKNEWIAYVDSDNVVYGNFLLSFADAIHSHPEATSFYAKLFFKYRKNLLSRYFNHQALLQGNYVDMGVFVHHCSLPSIYGNFDVKAARLEDWDLIIRYTRDEDPCFVDALVLEYYDDDAADRMTTRFDYKLPMLYVQNKYKDMYPE